MGAGLILMNVMTSLLSPVLAEVLVPWQNVEQPRQPKTDSAHPARPACFGGERALPSLQKTVCHRCYLRLPNWLPFVQLPAERRRQVVGGGHDRPLGGATGCLGGP